MSDEAGLPKSTVNKVIKDCVPADLKIAAEVRDIVADASLGMFTLFSSFYPLQPIVAIHINWKRCKYPDIMSLGPATATFDANLLSSALFRCVSVSTPISSAYPYLWPPNCLFKEFLQLVASEANDICTKENKTLIAADHIMKALTNLGFNEYLDEVTQYQAKLKRESAERSEKSKSSSNTEGLTDAELYAQQQALFEATN